MLFRSRIAPPPATGCNPSGIKHHFYVAHPEKREKRSLILVNTVVSSWSIRRGGEGTSMTMPRGLMELPCRSAGESCVTTRCMVHGSRLCLSPVTSRTTDAAAELLNSLEGRRRVLCALRRFLLHAEPDINNTLQTRAPVLFFRVSFPCPFRLSSVSPVFQ